MIFGAVLAAGTGSRMKSVIPKQFMELSGKPIIIRTVEKMFFSGLFDYLIIAIHPDYNDEIRDLLKKYELDSEKIIVINGGKERIDSIQNVVDAVNALSTSEDDVVIMHDGVRPFISNQIMVDSIKKASETGACVAVTPATDTMYILDENGIITGFPERKTIFHGQAPDSFQIGILTKALNSLSEEERKTITGTVQICSSKGYKIATVNGDKKNMKITTIEDIAIAESIIREEELNESVRSC